VRQHLCPQGSKHIHEATMPTPTTAFLGIGFGEVNRVRSFENRDQLHGNHGDSEEIFAVCLIGAGSVTAEGDLSHRDAGATDHPAWE